MKKLSYIKIDNAITVGNLTRIGRAGECDLFDTGDDEDGYGIIAVNHPAKLAADTGFFDDGDFFHGSDYNPVVNGGLITCAFELDDRGNEP